MPDRAIEIDVGPKGLAYMRDCFVLGRTLSHELLSKREFGAGRVFTALPRSVEVSALEEFSTSLGWRGLAFDTLRLCAELRAQAFEPGPLLVPKPDMVEDLAERVQTFLGDDKDRLCVMENPLADATDPWLAYAEGRLLTLGPEVYHVLDESARDRTVVERTIRDAFTSFDPPLVGVLTYGRVELPGDRKTTTAELHDLAARATTIFMTAYRGEAFLYWTAG